MKGMTRVWLFGLFLLLVPVLSLPSLGATAKGKVLHGSPGEMEGAQAVLLSFDATVTEGEKISQISALPLNADGTFDFGEFEAKSGVKYFAVLFFEGRRFLSEGIEFQGQSNLEFSINLDTELAPAIGGQGPLTVKGKLLGGEEGRDYSGVPLMLLKMNPNAQSGPPVSPVVRSEANEDGGYEFPEISAEPGVSYLVGALLDGDRISSRPVEYRGQESLFIFVEIPRERVAPEDYPETFAAKGKLISAGENPPGAIPMMLLKFDPNVEGGPPFAPVVRTESKEDGSFRFPPVKPEEGVSYLAGALVGGRRLSSERIEYNGQTELEFEIEIPVYSGDYSKLDFLKSFLVLTKLENGVRVTEITEVNNRSDAILFEPENAPSKPLPEGAYDPKYFEEEATGEELNLFENNAFGLKVPIPPGPSRFFIEYDLDRNPLGLEFEHLLFEGTDELELMTQKGQLEIYPENLFMKVEENEIGDKAYFSLVSEELNGVASVRVRLGNLPIPGLYFIFAGGFALVMMAGVAFLAFFGPGKNKAAGSSESTRTLSASA